MPISVITKLSNYNLEVFFAYTVYKKDISINVFISRFEVSNLTKIISHHIYWDFITCLKLF